MQNKNMRLIIVVLVLYLEQKIVKLWKYSIQKCTRYFPVLWLDDDQNLTSDFPMAKHTISPWVSVGGSPWEQEKQGPAFWATCLTRAAKKDFLSFVVPRATPAIFLLCLHWRKELREEVNGQSVTKMRDFPGNLVARIPHSHCRGYGFHPQSGN